MTDKIFTKIYKLIACPAVEKQPRLPFYGYRLEDPDGNELPGCTKVVFTIEPDKGVFAKLTIHRKILDKDGKINEEVIENVDAEIEVRQQEVK